VGREGPAEIKTTRRTYGHQSFQKPGSWVRGEISRPAAVVVIGAIWDFPAGPAPPREGGPETGA